eukprot:1157126-Pelagomonas_calceolata.AAC.3
MQALTGGHLGVEEVQHLHKQHDVTAGWYRLLFCRQSIMLNRSGQNESALVRYQGTSSCTGHPSLIYATRAGV